MRCPSCGKWNKSNLPRCFYCGASFRFAPQTTVEEIDIPSADLPLKSGGAAQDAPLRRANSIMADAATTSMSRREINDRKQRGQQYQNMLKNARGNMAPDSLPPEVSSLEDLLDADRELSWSEKWRLKAKKRRMENKSVKTRFVEGARGMRLRFVEWKKHPVIRIVLRATWYALLIVFAFSGYFTYTKAAEYASAQQRAAINEARYDIADKSISVSEGSATVQKSAKEITFYGEENDVIFIKEFKKSYVVTGGKAIVTIPDEDMIPEWPETNDSTLEVALTPRISTAKGDQITLDPIKYAVDIPMSEVTILKPEKPHLEITDEMYTIVIKVAENSIVTINNESIGDLRDSSGQILHNVTVESIEDNIYTLSVSQPHHQRYVSDIYITRHRQEIPLQFTNSPGESTTTSTLTLSGTVMPGAELIIESEHREGEVVYDPATGKFQFIAVFQRIGVNTIKVRAKMEGLTDSVITKTISYVPSLDEYSRKAWPLNYSELLDNVANNQGRVFVFTGRVTEIIAQEPFTFLMDVSENPKKKQMVAVESPNMSGLQVGEYLQIYGDAQSEYEGFPLLVGRHIYPQESGNE